MTAKQNLSFVLPAKNESAVVGNVVRDICSRFPSAEVIVVDDGSIDDTAEQAMQAGARVISHKYSVGNGGAIKSGARAAHGDILIFMDADGQHAPSDAEKLVSRLKSGFDMVVGARQKGSQASIARGLGNRLYNGLASYMAGQRIEDLTSGFRAVRANKFREFLYLLPNGFSYPTTCTMAFFRAGYSVGYEPINASKRLGESHLNLVKDGVRFLLIIFKVGTLYSPLKLFAPLAVVFFLLGVGWYGYTFYIASRFTNMSALLISGGFIVFMMGLISEQITALMYKDSR